MPAVANWFFFFGMVSYVIADSKSKVSHKQAFLLRKTVDFSKAHLVVHKSLRPKEKPWPFTDQYI